MAVLTKVGYCYPSPKKTENKKISIIVTHPTVEEKILCIFREKMILLMQILSKLGYEGIGLLSINFLKVFPIFKINNSI